MRIGLSTTTEPVNIKIQKRDNMNTLTQKLLNITSKSFSSSSLQQDVETVCQHMEYSKLRIAVFAPFNHGKSTLLNALLGSKTLPIALIPTTGTAITIKYGETLKTCIQLRDGREIQRDGTEILQEYAVLDSERHMREDVVSVDVFCPNSLLAKGIELIDLPGTSDMETQDQLVYNELLTVDLVISVLDARKLLTMGEIDKLQEWLIRRGINTAIFILNFANLIEEVEERKNILERARYIAREFRGNFLPHNISNLYQVDALPALRARVKGDSNLALESGIVTFENALEQIVALLIPQIKQLRLPRIKAISNHVKQSLEQELKKLQEEISIIDRARYIEIQRNKQEAAQMQNVFLTALGNLCNWISEDNFVTGYHSECLRALHSNELQEFENSRHKTLTEYLDKLYQLLCEGIAKYNTTIPSISKIYLPNFPEIDFPTRPAELDEETGTGGAVLLGMIGGFFIAGPWGAAGGGLAAKEFAENAAKERRAKIESEYNSQIRAVLNRAVREYLRSFSQSVLEVLPQYKASATVFTYNPPAESSGVLKKREQLNQLGADLRDLEKELTKEDVMNR